MSDLERHRRLEHNSLKTTVEPAKMSNISPIAPSHKEMKHWAKAHRTEIAASSSSLLASVVAVSFHQLSPALVHYRPTKTDTNLSTH